MPGFYDGFPWVNGHQLNLDWLIKTMKQLSEQYPEDFKKLSQEVKQLSGEVGVLTEKVSNFDYDYISGLLEKYIPAMMFPEISDAGYIVINIPESWDNITFNTTGHDITLELQPEYGHLVLSY